MTVPPSEFGQEVVSIDPRSLERQRRRYASRAIAYLVALNGLAALIVLASLVFDSHLSRPDRLADAMMVFGVGVTVALGSSFFAYLRRTVRLQAPERIPLRVSLWWLSMLAAIVASACFLIGLSMAGRAAIPDRAGISSGAKFKGDKEHRDQWRAKREDRNERRDDKRKHKDEEDKESKAPAFTAPNSESTTETVPAWPQPLTRTDCEEAGRIWNENAHICD